MSREYVLTTNQLGFLKGDSYSLFWESATKFDKRNRRIKEEKEAKAQYCAELGPLAEANRICKARVDEDLKRIASEYVTSRIKVKEEVDYNQLEVERRILMLSSMLNLEGGALPPEQLANMSLRELLHVLLPNKIEPLWNYKNNLYGETKMQKDEIGRRFWNR